MTLDDIVDGPEVKKVLLMSTADVIENRVLGHFDATLPGSGATWTQALDTMLEIVPEGECAPVDARPRSRAACRLLPACSGATPW